MKNSWPLLSAIAAFVLTRFWLLGFFTPAQTDVMLYLEYAIKGVDLGMEPYRDVPVTGALEYPPLGYWMIAAPRLLDDSRISWDDYFAHGKAHYAEAYLRTFQDLQAACDLAAFVLLSALAWWRCRSSAALVAWGYVLTTALLPHVVFTRLDMGVMLILALWSVCWYWHTRGMAGQRASQVLAYTVLGLGGAYKLLPLVIVPFLIVADGRAARSRRDWLWLGLSLAALGVAVGGPFLYHYERSGNRVFALFEYHGLRPIEIESIYASVLLVVKQFGVPVQLHRGFGSINLVTPGSGWGENMQLGATLILGAVLLAAGVRSLWPRQKFDRDDAWRYGCWAIVSCALLGKVLSVQFLVWCLPLMLLIVADRVSRRAIGWALAVAIGIAALSTLVFPYLFFTEYPLFGVWHDNPYPLVPDLHPVAWGALLLRNCLLVGLWAWLSWQLVRNGRTIAPSTAAC